MRTLRAFFLGRDSESGQAIILIAITLLAMIMIVGLAIDTGQLYSARRSMQHAADAAAYAGSVVLYQGGTQQQAFDAATADATSNGYTHNVGGATVVVRQPLTAPYNTADFIEVLISAATRTALTPGQGTVTQLSVAPISGAERLNNRYAMMVLDRNPTNNAFLSAPGSRIDLIGGAVLVNSTGGPAANSGTALGDWTLNCPVTNPCQIDIAGAATGTWPAAQPPVNYNGMFTGQPQQADPFAGYPKPSTAGMAVDPPAFGSCGGTCTLRSGIYTTVITGKKLCSGIYILKGAGMGGDINSDTTSIDPATGLVCNGKVFIFNTLNNYPASGGTCAGVVVSGALADPIRNLAPMTTGTYAGMLMYQDPACAATLLLDGSSSRIDVTGTIYLPNAKFQLAGLSRVAGGQIIAKTVDLGTGRVELNFSATTSAQPVLPRLAK